jgi:hypothetical protein
MPTHSIKSASGSQPAVPGTSALSPLRVLQIVTCAPTSITRPVGIWKKSEASVAVLARLIKSRSCHCGIPERTDTLIARRERPCRHRAPDRFDEIASSHGFPHACTPPYLGYQFRILNQQTMTSQVGRVRLRCGNPRSIMSQMGQSRHIDDVSDECASPPIPVEVAHCSEL